MDSDAPKITKTDVEHTIEHAGWRVQTFTYPISNAAQLDDIQAVVGFPLPEMTFGANALTLTHLASGWTYTFDTLEALKGVKNGELGDGDGGVRVGYADAWLKSRTDPNSNTPMPKTVETKPYDWTYTTIYSGHEPDSSTLTLDWRPADANNPAHTIPMSELTRRDPILYYAHTTLYDDELHDNGESSVLARVRVMPTFIFVLVRFCLRVDNVLFRVHDTRLYHSFASSPPLIIKETSGWEAPYNSVKRKLPDKRDLTPLTDTAFIATSLAEIEGSQQQPGVTKWRGLGTQTQVATIPS
ncbi:type 2A phosphatase activator TIP41 [Exidia glandulosa HHB12029]|uniref:Type 2A phosphatase activator TIP41 n=1 Tax=Exidia glandulosa HHB12029 TaxID=1314781 RepID=A0A165R1G6_EXIGL|nr:type 2A phosphatase activator TIP41 [Exidia glandulosa HHB12029]